MNNLGNEISLPQIGRLEQLWKLATEFVLTDPALSQYFCRSLIRKCRDSDIALANSFYYHVCASCGSIYIFGVNCTVRLWRLSRLRRAIRDKALHGPISFASQTLFIPSNQALDNAKKTHAIVYSCKVCTMHFVFDSHGYRVEPLLSHHAHDTSDQMKDLSEPQSKVPPPNEINNSPLNEPTAPILPTRRTLVDQKKKAEQLQKVLSKHIVPSSSTSLPDLKSFLKRKS